MRFTVAPPRISPGHLPPEESSIVLHVASGAKRSLPAPDPWLRGLAPAFSSPLPGPALDAACGSGRNALWLASLLGAGAPEVVGVDVSASAVALANAYASDSALPARFVAWDLEARGFPPGRWGAILLFHFLDRRLFACLSESLAPGGLLAIRTHLAHPLRPPDARPRRPTYLLRPGELLSLGGFEILDYREVATGVESWAALLARRTAPPPAKPARFSPLPPPEPPQAPRSGSRSRSPA